MDNRKALLMAWLEEESERQARPVLLLSAARDPDPRGWVQVGVCAIGGALTVAILLCWLVRVGELANRVTVMEQLRLEGFREAAGDPNKSVWKEKGATDRSNGYTFEVLLCFRVFAIAFGTVIGALFLRAGCLLYNKLVGGKGSPSSVPEPLVGKAMVITFVTTLMNAVVEFRLLTALGSFLIMAAMISALLPTTFVRGILVVLCYLLVGICVVVALAVTFGGLLLILTPLR